MIISLDTETTGTDLRHGAKPFLVTICDEDYEIAYWEWDVDPYTREPYISNEDLLEIIDYIESADLVVMQNSKFDVGALAAIFPPEFTWPWDKTEDTLISAHLLGSNRPKDLTSMSLEYLGVNVKPVEDVMEKEVKRCRNLVRNNSEYDGWRIAEPGLPEMPSAKGKVWKYDLWLPKAMDHNSTVTAEYANTDSPCTLGVYFRHQELLKERGLEKIYHYRLKLPPIIYKMESYGVTINGRRLEQQTEEYKEESERLGRICVNIAKKYEYDLSLPKSGTNNSLREFVFEHMKLEPVKGSKKTGEPSLDSEAMEAYRAELPNRSLEASFIRSLSDKRSRDTAVIYMESYKRFWKPTPKPGWYRLHPSLNSTGTDTLRFSSSNPSEQNISKKEGFNLRYSFGPAPGREWYSMDARNIELRIPAYESGEQELIRLFENPEEPPYYGSTHLLNFHTVYPDIWEEVLKEVGFEKVGPTCKKRFAATWYQWCKNGGFAVQYGAVERADQIGTADRAFHREGSHAKLKQRFSKLEKLNQRCIDMANRLGYVETIPDKTVDPSRGYPLLCTRSQWGDILPTVPLNYHVQGTAMQWMCKAMVRCQKYLDTLSEIEAFIVMQVHDELVFDFPKSRSMKGGVPSNFKYVERLAELMETGGDDIGVPTPVGIEYHTDSWSEGVTLV